MTKNLIKKKKVKHFQVRTISFSHDGALLASASEDMRIDIGHVETTQKVAEIAVDSPTFTISWHPSRYIIFTCM